MKCPLLKRERFDEEGNPSMEGTACLKEECAWWDVDYGECGFLSFLSVLRDIAGALSAIRNKMPHAGQFTK